MKFNKEELEKFRNDPMMKMLSSIYGINHNELINDAIKELEDMPEETIQDEVDSAIKELLDLGVIKEVGKNDNGEALYEVLPKSKKETKINDEHKALNKNIDVKPILDSGRSFAMSEKDLESWIDEYRELENIFSKLSYLYGIDFKAGNDNSIYTRYNRLVWTLIESIFGSDNRDDIADYVFRNSNFDSVKDLYAELT